MASLEKSESSAPLENSSSAKVVSSVGLPGKKVRHNANTVAISAPVNQRTKSSAWGARLRVAPMLAGLSHQAQFPPKPLS